MKTVLVLGGDGFCGWPTALHLSRLGYDVCIVDNLSRRNIDNQLQIESLTPIEPIMYRIGAWKELTGLDIEFKNFNIATDYQKLLKLIKDKDPESIVHFAEQRSAPFSMKSSDEKLYTVNNNVGATNNLMSAVVEAKSKAHVVHLGSMGVYGYKTTGVEIPEGYLNVHIEGDKEGKTTKILYPSDPGSIYHLTKVQDQYLFAFYNKNDNIPVTDLHQGVVWGTQTDETALDDRLVNRFDYDGDYGTVLNRFLMQAAIGHPLTVYGSGGQTRAFIHVKDMVRCIEIAIQNKPNAKDGVRVLNQMTETFKVIDLAKIVSEQTGAKIEYLENPRNEADNNDLIVNNDTFIKMGLEPTTLHKGLLEEIHEIALKYTSRCRKDRIVCTSLWRTNDS
jgi:UDP-sulfoquinovose synthase